MSTLQSSLYTQEFTRILGVLEKATTRQSDSDLTEWVKRNIKNREIKTFMCSQIITLSAPSPKYDVIFQHVEFFIKNLEDEYIQKRTVLQTEEYREAFNLQHRSDGAIELIQGKLQHHILNE